VNWTIFKSSLHLRRNTLFWYSLGITLYGWLIVAFYPLIEKNADYLDLVQSMLTPELMAIFGGANLDFATIGGFLGIEYLNLFWIFIVSAAIITFAANALAGAVDDGTMEATLAQPVSRLQVAFVRYLAMASYAAALNLVTILTLYIPGLIHNVDVPLDSMLLLFAIGWLLTMAIGSFAYMVSALSTGSGRVVGISLGTLLAMWLADVLGNITDKVDWLKNISLFHYWQPVEVIDKLSVASESWLVFGVAVVLFFAVAMWAFQRRDVV